VHGGATNAFRCGVAWRASGAATCVILASTEVNGDAKVAQCRVRHEACMEAQEYILWFDVPVDHSIFVETRQGLCKTAAEQVKLIECAWAPDIEVVEISVRVVRKADGRQSIACEGMEPFERAQKEFAAGQRLQDGCFLVQRLSANGLCHLQDNPLLRGRRSPG